MKIYASVALVFGLVLSSCSYQLSTHNFYYHGTDSIGNQEDFYYVKQGLTGTSRTSYTVRGGGDVREGLVADAKADMFANFPLGPNQMYANLSVDIIQTERGVTVDGQKSPNRIDLQCTVSADIIQYGKAPEMGAQPNSSVQTLESLTQDVSLIGEQQSTVSVSGDRMKIDVVKNEIVELQIEKGGSQLWVDARVIKLFENYDGEEMVQLKYVRKEGGMYRFKTLLINSPRWRLK